jgi:hypothetical protein
LFPSLEADLLAAGAIAGDVIGSARWHQHRYTKARFASGSQALFMSRPLLEGLVRDQVGACRTSRFLTAVRRSDCWSITIEGRATPTESLLLPNHAVMFPKIVGTTVTQSNMRSAA